MTDSPIFATPDREVWVVEAWSGAEWRVLAVLTSHSDAEQYEDDYREWAEEHNKDVPDDYNLPLRTKHGGRKSPTKMFKEYPPENDD